MATWLCLMVILATTMGCSAHHGSSRSDHGDSSDSASGRPIKWGDPGPRLPGESVGPIREYHNFYQIDKRWPAYVVARYTVNQRTLTEHITRCA